MTNDPRRRRRPIPILAALAMVGVSAAICWRMTSLDGLPDIGDPFDVEAFCRPIPDETNAFVIYKEASRMLGQEPTQLAGTWDSAGEGDKKWLADSRDALELWRRGTERPDALYLPPGSMTFRTELPVILALRTFARLATLEATRREAEKDYDGALDWYLAILRTSRHAATRATAIGRILAVAIHAGASDRLIRLASDPKVGDATLRRALDAAIAIDSRTPPNSDLMKAEYLVFRNAIGDPGLGDPADLAAPAHTWWTPFRRWSFGLRKVILKEPERSRRLARLIIANRLAYCDLPVLDRPPTAIPLPAPGVGDPPNSVLYNWYAPGPRPVGSAHILSPEEVDRWAGSSIYVRENFIAFWAIDRALARERSAQASLVLSLANALYKRDHGKPPDSPRELVGPYLKALPDGYVVPE